MSAGALPWPLMPKRPILRLPLPALLTSALVLSACSGNIEIAAPPTPVPTTPTPAPTATAVPTPVPTSTPTAEPGPPQPVAFQLDPRLLLRLPPGWSPDFGGETGAIGPRDGLPPGGTVPPPSRGDRWRYVGVLGRLKPDDQVVAAVADPPAAVIGAAPLTGLPGRSPRRPAVIVKIDNVPQARPQTGLNRADIVYEELVEAGLTRFAAVFHSARPGTIGPVRSGRSTDIGIITSFNRPIFAFSGANSIFDRLIDKQPIRNRSAELFNGYWRSSSRRAPHNMYTGADTLLDSVSAKKRPPAHFAYRDPGEALHRTAQHASSVRLVFQAGSSPGIEYRWNDGDGGWRRWQSGTRHVDADGVQLAPANLIVQIVNYIDTGMTDKWGEVLYEGVSVGSGRALVFTDGHVIEATWTRPTLGSVTTFTDAAGEHVELTPGQTFVALIAPGGVAWS